MPRILITSLSALLLAACGGSETTETSESVPANPSNETPAAQSPAPESAPVETAAAEPESEPAPDYSAVLAALGPGYENADVDNGARAYRRCQSCHQVVEGGRNMVGPNLHGILDQPAAAVEGFNYSRQLSEAGLVWDVATMDSWLENPRALVPGNRMSFVGLRDADDRRDVIAYIAVQSAN